MEQVKGCPFCGYRPSINLGKLTGCQLHGEPMQSVVIRCHWDKCPAKPSISAGDIYNGGREKATAEAIAIWNHRTPSEGGGQ